MKPLQGIPINADFSKPLDVLFHCHQKIAANLETLRRSTESLRSPKSEELPAIFASIDMAFTHFQTAGIKHTQDEEKSLFPRIRSHKDAVVSEVFEIVDQLEGQHKRAASIEKSLRKLYVKMVLDEPPDINRVDLFCDLSESLYDLYRPHIQIENEFVFPAAAQILSAVELFEIGREMYQRRQLSIHLPRK